MAVTREALYWRCQATGWSFYGLMAAGIPTLYGGLRWLVVLRALAGIALGVFLTDRLRRHLRRHEWLGLPLRRLAPRVGVATLLIATTMMLALLPLLGGIFVSGLAAGPLTAVFLIHITMVLGWILIYVAYHYLQGVRAAEADRWRRAIPSCARSGHSSTPTSCSIA
jgi:hypothetical protein